eukprot:15460754-Heterocapsa_arctica.AAC.1
MRGTLNVFGNGFLPLPIVPGGTNNEAQVSAVVGNGDVAPIRARFMDSFPKKNVQAAREERDENGLSHIEFEARHDGIFPEGRKDIVRRFFKVRNHHRSIVRKGSEKR